MSEDLVCWRCGRAVEDEPLPLSRRAECKGCRAELHVCRMCVHFDPRIATQCREDRAEDVTDKEHANFCDWFKPRPDAYRPPDEAKADAARAGLEALFGADPESGADPEPKNAAREELERLFGLDKKTDD
jgi:hypothetical protein